MKGYLGQFPVDIQQTKYKDYTPADWAMYFIERYGQIDGNHHKLWVLDQVARILKGTPVIVNLAKWDNGYEEYRVWTGSQSQEYSNWVLGMLENDDGEIEYRYNEGIAP